MLRPITGADSDDNLPIGFVEKPIVAWRIETAQRENDDELIDSATPITTEGCSDIGEQLIERPDGHVVAPYEEIFDSRAEALESCREKEVAADKLRLGKAN